MRQTLVAIAYSHALADARILQPGPAAPRTQHRLLQRVLGVVYRAEHPVAVRVELGSVLPNQVREVGAVGFGRGGQGCSTTINVCPVGSRNQNIGGTGSPIRDTSASTSTPRAFSSAWVASMSPWSA